MSLSAVNIAVFNVVPASTVILIRAREIVGFAGSGPIFETENRFVSRQEAKKSVHKTLFSQDLAIIHRLTLSPVRIVHT